MHDRMVGVIEHPARDIVGFIPSQFFLIQQDAHQVRDRESRMDIIDLNDDFFRQGAHITVELLVFTHNALHRRGSKEVILPQAQHPAGKYGHPSGTELWRSTRRSLFAAAYRQSLPC